jgi:hypothetical protein
MAAIAVDVTLLNQLYRALQRTRQFGADTLDRPMWEPMPGAEAAGEIADAVKLFGHDRQIRTTYAIANVLMIAVLDQLGALQCLLQNPMPVIAPTVVARSAIEIASLAWWLMEPGIGGKRRVSRDLVLSLASAREAAVVADLLFGHGPDCDDTLDQERQVLQRISDAGLQVSGTRKSPRVGTEAAASATEQTADMLHAGLGTKNPPTAVYKAYSATAHGTIYGLMNFMASRMEPDGANRLHWGPRADVLDSTVQTAIIAFRQAWDRVNTVMGWDNAKIAQEWADDLDKIFNP